MPSVLQHMQCPHLSRDLYLQLVQLQNVRKFFVSYTDRSVSRNTNELAVDLATIMLAVDLRVGPLQHEANIAAKTNASFPHQQLASLCSAHSSHTQTLQLENAQGDV